jgi:hypothetical protein
MSCRQAARVVAVVFPFKAFWALKQSWDTALMQAGNTQMESAVGILPISM